MAEFPPYVHTLHSSSDPQFWPVVGQGKNECSFTSTANGLNILCGEARFSKDMLAREALFLFQPQLGGTLPPIKVPLIRRRGFGTHFGNLSRTDYGAVLRDLIDRRVPVVIEIGVGVPWAGPRLAWGQHAILLVGYSDPYRDASGELREEFYVYDSEWPALGQFDPQSNNVDRDGDGVAEPYPGNRTFSRAELDQWYVTRSYYPLFPSQAAHDAWYAATIRPLPQAPLVGWLQRHLLTGSYDVLNNASREQNGARLGELH